ncbi:hypothetical protein [Sphingobacterium hotanense]|uniref:Uncharacterized protein n=1 Tax=Sphingobacterium hotanense TaxID=649196 RepID=A0ABT7NPC7_9SPHI|nr:hypothetical protein [Sphingobacterium hotanense]MDM1049109.1 hypothetical protein [Sphingobacterium hotanense]
MITNHTPQRWIYFIPVVLLCIPIVAMQFTNEVNWNAIDFLVAGILLFGSVFIIDLLWRNVKNKRNFWIGTAIVLFLLIILWAELAVGIFGSPIAGS